MKVNNKKSLVMISRKNNLKRILWKRKMNQKENSNKTMKKWTKKKMKGNYKSVRNLFYSEVHCYY